LAPIGQFRVHSIVGYACCNSKSELDLVTNI
jgi:hypothetical protein